MTYSACDSPPTAGHRALVGGARAMAPWLLGIVPYGIVIGLSAANADIPTAAGWLTGPLVYSGSAQVATIQLLESGAAPVVVVIAALAINLRLVLYSATMARHWKGVPLRWQALAAYALVDPSLAVGVEGYERLRDRRTANLHYAGGALTLWLAWVAAITLGATVGTALPAGLHLELVVPLFLVGEVVRRVTTRAVAHGVATAVVLGLFARWVPLHLGVLIAIAGGTAAALYSTERDRR
jgi:predicted branched-subunit amino acid permease